MVVVIRLHCSTTYRVGVAYCYRWNGAVCLSVSPSSYAVVSPAKMAEPIDMSFGLWTRVGPRNHGLDGVNSPMRRGNFERGQGAAHCKVQGLCAMSCAEPTEILLGMWTPAGPRNHGIQWDAHWCHLANTIEPSMRPYVKLL